MIPPATNDFAIVFVQALEIAAIITLLYALMKIALFYAKRRKQK